MNVDIEDVMYLKEVLEEMPQALFAEFTQLNDVLRICNEMIEEHIYGGNNDERKNTSF